MVSMTPESPGVYALYSNGEVIYYGSSTTSVRDRLKDHQSGREGRCTQSATHYNYDTTMSDPVAAERALLTQHQKTYGRLPRCNSRIP